MTIRRISLTPMEFFVVISLIFAHLQSLVTADVVALTNDNFDSIVNNADVVFINFYADWCRFSQMLTPVFQAASDKFKGEPQSKVVWGAVDCDRQPQVAQRFGINKYPTLKLFRNGQVAKREYRGQRSEDSLADFVRQQMNSAIVDFASNDELTQKIENNKRKVIAYFATPQGTTYENFIKISSNLREECKFYIGVGQEFQTEVGQTGFQISFRGSNAPVDETHFFNGDATNYALLNEWITDKCIPLVREITFENAEELTEEGLPFLILFRKEEDKDSLEIFQKEVSNQLWDQKNSINCLYADGRKFAHPLHHLGKSENDLPIIAIDSFRHMYLFPSFSEIQQAGKLRQFVQDLHSGKLHREFHHGPDPTQPSPDGQQQPDAPANQPPSTDPPESVFKKLQPSHTRYTLLDKDEL